MARARVPVTETALAEAALRYLNRVPASRTALIRKLEDWVRRRGEPPDPGAARPLILALVNCYEVSGLIDDRKLAEGALQSLRGRGLSRRAIQQKLKTRGIPEALVAEALVAEKQEQRERASTSSERASSDPELVAAKAFVRKRRLGSFRPEIERGPNRQRDLAALARRGFDFDTALRALGGGRDDEF